jgi:hypothetical protein
MTSSPNATPIARTSSLPETSSGSGSSPRVSSPLNPSSTPTKSTTPLPSSPYQLLTPTSHGSGRVHHAYASDPGDDMLGLRKFTSTSGEASSISLPEDFGGGLTSTFRDRSRSPVLESRNQIAETGPGTTNLTSSWYGDKHVHRRPWHESPKRKKTVPQEQTIALEETRKVCVSSTLSEAF